MVVIIDLFCGCGGFSAGAAQAGHDVVLAIDADLRALALHFSNFPDADHVLMELGGDPKEFATKLLHYIGDREYHIHGSPPCQGYSTLNNKVANGEHVESSNLAVWYLDLIEALVPKSWSFENVYNSRHRIYEERPWVKNFHCHEECYGSEFGVPIMRKRFVISTTDMSSVTYCVGKNGRRHEDPLLCPVTDFLPDLTTEVGLHPQEIGCKIAADNRSAVSTNCDRYRPVDTTMGEGIRPITWSAYSISSRPARIDWFIRPNVYWEQWRPWTDRERATVMGFSSSYVLPVGKVQVIYRTHLESPQIEKLQYIGPTSHKRAIGNAIVPAIARFICDGIQGLSANSSSGDLGGVQPAPAVQGGQD